MAESTDAEEAMRQAPLIGYAQRQRIPSSSGVYTAWLDSEPRCLYVGKAGKSANGNLKKCIQSHFSGQRGSDQFCLYVYDAYIHAERCRQGEEMTTKQINDWTGDWIRKRIKFRWIEIDEQQIGSVESEFRRKWQPVLNPL